MRSPATNVAISKGNKQDNIELAKKVVQLIFDVTNGRKGLMISVDFAGELSDRRRGCFRSLAREPVDASGVTAHGSPLQAPCPIVRLPAKSTSPCNACEQGYEDAPGVTAYGQPPQVSPHSAVQGDVTGLGVDHMPHLPDGHYPRWLFDIIYALDAVVDGFGLEFAKMCRPGKL